MLWAIPPQVGQLMSGVKMPPARCWPVRSYCIRLRARLDMLTIDVTDRPVSSSGIAVKVKLRKMIRPPCLVTTLVCLWQDQLLMAAT